MFKKKKAEVVPDGDDYADDTAVYKTRRELDMEVQRRHFKVRAARGGEEVQQHGFMVVRGGAGRQRSTINPIFSAS